MNHFFVKSGNIFHTVIFAAALCFSGSFLAVDHTPAAYATQLPTAQKWCAPLGKLHISRKYLKPQHRYASGHRGIDIFASQSSGSKHPVAAPAAGTVTFVGKVGFRQVISVKTDDNTVYSIEPVVSDLQPGDSVKRCQILGEVEAYGHTQPGEIHLGVRVADEYVNPLQYFRAKPRLLPLAQNE